MINSHAQLIVNPNGRIQIGDSLVTDSKLSIYSVEHSSIHIDGGKSHGIEIWNTALSNNYTKSGLYIYNPIQANKSYKGIFVDSYGENTDKEVWGVHSIAGGSTLGNYGILGCLRNANKATYGVGVFGSVLPVAVMSKNKGIYAGFFYGDVCVTGGLYATLLTPT